MILKIVTSDPNSSEDSYWLLDDIRKINKTGVFLKSDVNTDQSFDICLFSYAHEEQYVEMVCRRDDTGTEFSVATDGVVYVLNDNGKTVDRILPRY